MTTSAAAQPSGSVGELDARHRVRDPGPVHQVGHERTDAHGATLRGGNRVRGRRRSRGGARERRGRRRTAPRPGRAECGSATNASRVSAKLSSPRSRRSRIARCRSRSSCWARSCRRRPTMSAAPLPSSGDGGVVAGDDPARGVADDLARSARCRARCARPDRPRPSRAGSRRPRPATGGDPRTPTRGGRARCRRRRARRPARPSPTSSRRVRATGRVAAHRRPDRRPRRSACAGATIMLWNPASSKYWIASASTVVRMQSCGTIGFSTVVPCGDRAAGRGCRAPPGAGRRSSRRPSTGGADRGGGRRPGGTTRRRDELARDGEIADARSRALRSTSSMTVSALTAAASSAARPRRTGRRRRRR